MSSLVVCLLLDCFFDDGDFEALLVPNNIGIVVKNWGEKAEAKVKVDGKDVDVKQGAVRDVDGSYTMNIFIKKQTTEAVNIEIAK